MEVLRDLQANTHTATS